jgi:predicted anti-sigma-YlaC factor YlaD
MQGDRRAKGKRRSACSGAECRALFASLSCHLDEKQQERVRAHLARHLRECSACLAFLDSLDDAVRRIQSGSGREGVIIGARLREVIFEHYRAIPRGVRKNAARR